MEKVRIYTDESVNVAITEGLKRRGVEAWSAKDAGKLGLTDEEQLQYATSEKASIFSHDDDFLKVAVRWIKEGKMHYGVIYAHRLDYSIGECMRKLKLVADILTQEDMINHIEFL